MFYNRFTMSSLERALSRFRRRPQVDGPEPPRRPSAAFRAEVEVRLRALEREMGDLRGRINGLIFLVAGAVITQVVLKLVQ